MSDGEQELSAAEIGRRLAAQRKQVEKICAKCGKHFVGFKRKEEAYCSGRCRKAAYDAKKKATRQAHQENNEN